MFSYTLHVQSEGYARMRSTRVFLCASSPDESGRQALDWCLESLVQDGDELVVFRGVDPDDFGRLSVSSSDVYSVLIPITADNDHDQYREDARGLMHQIQEKCVEYDAERKLSIIVEYIAGKVTQTLDRLIALYRPDSVVVGTRGQRSVMQAWAGAFGAPGVGSVSKYVSFCTRLRAWMSQCFTYVCVQILFESLARTGHCRSPGEQSQEDHGEAASESETRATLRRVRVLHNPLLHETAAAFLRGLCRPCISVQE